MTFGFKYFFLLAVLLFQPSAFARPKCDQQLASKKVEIADAFWSQETPIFIHTADGQDLPITYSFDTEIPDAQIYSAITKDKNLHEVFNRESVHVYTTVGKAASKFEMSPKQFRAFAVRKDASLAEGSDARVYASQLFPKYIGAAFFAQFEALRKKTVRNWFPELPINTEMDGLQVEIRHKTYETTPSGYKSIIETIHSAVDFPQTHFHLGIPAEALTETQFTAVVRALETRIILRLAIDDPNPDQKLSFNFSYLPETGITDKLNGGYRGVVKAELAHFTMGEHVAHDLELRQWDTTEQALSELKWVIALLQNPGRIGLLPGQNTLTPYVTDPYTQNLKGALEYAGRALTLSKIAHRLEVGRKLLTLSEKMTDSSNPSPELRSEAAKLLEHNHVLDLLDTEAFTRE